MHIANSGFENILHILPFIKITCINMHFKDLCPKHYFPYLYEESLLYLQATLTHANGTLYI